MINLRRTARGKARPGGVAGLSESAISHNHGTLLALSLANRLD